MPHHIRTALGTILALPMLWPICAAATPFTGPTSQYYLNNAGTGSIYIVLGTAAVGSFPYAYASSCTGFPGYFCEGSLAVTNVVSTNGFYPVSPFTDMGAGQYT